jgi:energy-coupling factor transport system ATP-binding protein
VDGADVARLSLVARRRSIALVPEALDDLLFANSVAAECARADRRAAAPGTAGLFLSFLGLEQTAPRAAELLARHPRDLSAGQRCCLAIAIQLSARPRVLLVDEPTRGLDPAARALVGAALLSSATAGTAVVVATHDVEFAATYASRSIRMERGRLTAPVSAVSP